ncbi:MAG: radical SAM protein, partial [Deltaproteobacteria bacterium]|nr:radical SAM protein [Deltaproteobacteria bacterium]
MPCAQSDKTKKVSVLIFGTGSMADNIIPAIRGGALEIKCFIDERPEKRGTTYCGKPVRGLDALEAHEFDYVLIACRQALLVATRLRMHCLIPENKLVPLDFEYICGQAGKQRSGCDLRQLVKSYLDEYPEIAAGFDLDVLLGSPWLRNVMHGGGGNLHIFIELTPACNMGCPFCPHPVLKRSKKPLDKKLADKFLTGLYDYGYRGLSVDLFLLGEPLLSKDIFICSKKASGVGFVPAVVTNGILAGKDAAHKLYEAGIRTVAFSVHSPDSACYALRDTSITYEDNLRRMDEFLLEWYLLGSDTQAIIFIMTTENMKNLKKSFPSVNFFDWYDSAESFNEKMGIFFARLDRVVERCFRHSPSLFVQRTADMAYRFQPAVTSGQLSFDRSSFDSADCRSSGYIFGPGMRVLKQTLMPWAKQKHFLAHFFKIPEEKISI